MDSTHKTQDQDKIKAWITNHHGRPVEFDYPDAEADKSGLRIDFPGYEDEILHNESITSKELTWEEFFTQLADRKLVFVYDENAGPDDDLTMAYRFELDETA